MIHTIARRLPLAVSIPRGHPTKGPLSTINPMARLTPFLVFVFISGLTPAAATDIQDSPRPGESRAHWVARRVQDRDTGPDSRINMRMTLIDRRGRERQRGLTIKGLRGG